MRVLNDGMFMIHWDNKSSLLATGLSLADLGQIMIIKDNEEKLIEKLKTLGEKYYHRYLVVKEYQNLIQQQKQKLPLIMILTGIPGIGKTALAKELSTRFNIGISIGGDALRSSFRAILPKEHNEVFFTSVYNAWQFFGEYSKESIISGYKAQSEIMNKAIERMIADRGIRDGESIIIEYLHFLPAQYTEEILSHPSVIPIIMSIADKAIYKERLLLRERYSHLRSPGNRLIEQMETYFSIQEFQLSESKKFGIPIINFENFDDGLDQTIDLIIARIEKLNDLKDFSIDMPLVEKIEHERERK